MSPKPRMPMRVLRDALRQHALPPCCFACCIASKKRWLAMDDQHMHGDILRHLMHQGGVDKAHQRQVVGKFRIAQKTVHARAQREHAFRFGRVLRKPGGGRKPTK